MNAKHPVREDDLHAFVDGQLDESDYARVRAYLERYPEAAARVEAMRDLRVSVKRAFDPIADEPLPQRLDLARLVREQRPTRSSAPIPGLPGEMAWYRAGWRMAAAVLMSLGIGGTGGWWLHGGADVPGGPGRSQAGAVTGISAGIAALSEEAVSSYAVYAADPLRPVELGADDRKQLVNWLSNRLHRRVMVPDLGAAGFRFLGGRLVATVHGPAGLLVYDGPQGERVAMLVRGMTVDQNAPMTPHAQGAILGYSWADQGTGYSVVSESPSDRLHPLANEMRRQIRDAAAT